jgi:hypothetical protein
MITAPIVPLGDRKLGLGIVIADFSGQARQEVDRPPHSVLRDPTVLGICHVPERALSLFTCRNDVRAVGGFGDPHAAALCLGIPMKVEVVDQAFTRALLGSFGWIEGAVFSAAALTTASPSLSPSPQAAAMSDTAANQTHLSLFLTQDISIAAPVHRCTVCGDRSSNGGPACLQQRLRVLRLSVRCRDVWRRQSRPWRSCALSSTLGVAR